MNTLAFSKEELIGGCARLSFKLNAKKLAEEVEGLDSAYWGTTSGRVGVHTQADSIFLRGHAPAERKKTIGDREVMQRLPYIREIINELVPAPPLLCLIASLMPGGSVSVHTDKADYFTQSIRLHFPVVTNPLAKMYCNGYTYHMQPGEVWALNNSADHGVLNNHASESRIHIIADFRPTPELLSLLTNSDKTLGKVDPECHRKLAEIYHRRRAKRLRQ